MFLFEKLLEGHLYIGASAISAGEDYAPLLVKDEGDKYLSLGVFDKILEDDFLVSKDSVHADCADGGEQVDEIIVFLFSVEAVDELDQEVALLFGIGVHDMNLGDFVDVGLVFLENEGDKLAYLRKLDERLEGYG